MTTRSDHWSLGAEVEWLQGLGTHLPHHRRSNPIRALTGYLRALPAVTTWTCE